MSGNELHLGLFAKYWEPGHVKTRLAATLGDVKAAVVYRLFVETLLSRCSRIGRSRELVFTPEAREPEFREWVAQQCGDWDVQPQGVGDLGKRMQRFFQRTLSSHRKVVLIGTDSPTIPRDFFDQADDLLETNSVVLGPSADGGYYLVGVRDRAPAIFSGIDWSTDRVWWQTLERLRADGIRYATLPEWYDVDDESDLRRLYQEVNGNTDDDAIVKLSEEIKCC